MNLKTNWKWNLLSQAMFVALILATTNVVAFEERSPTVGAAGSVEQIILPGTELVGKPITEGDPIVVRVLNVFPHGDSFRYDIRFHGMEPGKFNLVDWLERKDGSEKKNLPNVEVTIRSLLPPGQIEPNELETGWIPRMGGYRVLMVAAIVLWFFGLLALIFAKRKKPIVETVPEKEMTLADLLKLRIESASENRMDKSQYAELERMLTAFWRRRLNLESEPPHLALAKIKSDEKAGPLMRQLETWMHSPDSSKDVDLAALLEPFKSIPADAPEFESK